MVIAHFFQEIFDISSQVPKLSLPIYKQNGLKIDFEDSDSFETVYKEREPDLPFTQSEVFHARISNWRLLTAKNTDCKSVYEITFDVEGSNFSFKSGDTIGIIPRNENAEVDVVIDQLNLSSQADQLYTLSIDTSQKGAKIPAHIPVKSSLRYVLTHCVDLRAFIKKTFLLALANNTKNEDERRVLEYLCSKEGSSDYTAHVLNRNLCILDIFKHFKTCRPPITVILANLPRLLPRPYSIVNSGLADSYKLKICFSVMDLGNNRKGLTTGWLEQIILKDIDIEDRLKNIVISDTNNFEYDHKVPIYLRNNINQFTLPRNLETPLILIGPGTGVAPFIGFLEEIMELYRKQGVKSSKIWLFYGCRNPKLDFIYEEELKSFLSNSILDKLSVAFSRVENNGIKYVQHALIQNGEEVIKLIMNGASVFICGDLKIMASQVKASFIECLIKYGRKSQEEAEKYLFDMEKDKRYLVDIWS